MKAHARDLIVAAVQALAGKVHTEEALHDVLYQLALDVTTPFSAGEPILRARRMPRANEVLPRHQRATWARGKTVYDAAEG